MNNRGSTALVLARASALAHCEHKNASDYQFLIRDASNHRRSILGRRCECCGAVETANMPWMAPRLARALVEALGDAADVASCLPSPAFDAESFAERISSFALGAATESVRELPASARTLSSAVGQLAELAAAFGEHGMAARLNAAAQIVTDFACALAPPTHERPQA